MRQVLANCAYCDDVPAGVCNLCGSPYCVGHAEAEAPGICQECTRGHMVA